MLNHYRIGSGEPLVLVHGVGSRWQVWEPIIDMLAERFEVFAVDLPGFGESESVPCNTVDTLTDALAAFIAEQGLERPHLAGNSMVGLIALTLGARGSARSVTAFSPIGFWSTPGRVWCRLALGGSARMGRWIRPVLPAVLGTAVGRTVFLSFFFGKAWAVGPQVALDSAHGGMDSPGFAAALASFETARPPSGGELDRIPVTIAWGSRDILLTYATQSRRARRQLPDAQHVTLTGSGHTPFYDDPSGCARLLLSRAM
ncbi:alpha/beta fold hydrolase [Nocardia crassostreae]|uniref:alpha/beta fold hydrolase n=1 Tax=Nocardia crassostreae TaxID=53428 RepID=UPI000831586F|nr:alpha/beta hydrolase [Nocardia crassostreae]